MTLLIQDVSVQLGSMRVVKNVSCEAKKGELIGLIGPNGAGKSTLLRAVAGILPIEAGKIEIKGVRLDQMSQIERSTLMAYLPQTREVKWPMPVRTIVGLGRRARLRLGAHLQASDYRAIEKAMEAMDIHALSERSATQLSGGETARVLMARALAQEPELLLADEPVAGLDPAHALSLMGYLKNMANDGMNVIVVMHDLTLAGQFCDRLMCLHEGEMANIGTPSRVLNAKTLREVYGVKAATAAHKATKLYVPVSRV